MSDSLLMGVNKLGKLRLEMFFVFCPRNNIFSVSHGGVCFASEVASISHSSYLILNSLLNKYEMMGKVARYM